MAEVSPFWERIYNALDCAYIYGNLMERLGRASAYLDVVCHPLPGDIEWETSKKKYTREFLKQYPFLDDLRKWYGIRAMNTLEDFLVLLGHAHEKGLVRAGIDMDRFRIPVESMAKMLFDFWANKSKLWIATDKLDDTFMGWKISTERPLGEYGKWNTSDIALFNKIVGDEAKIIEEARKMGLSPEAIRVILKELKESGKNIVGAWYYSAYEAPYYAEYILEHEKLINKVADLHERVVEKTLGKTLKQLEEEERRQKFYREVL